LKAHLQKLFVKKDTTPSSNQELALPTTVEKSENIPKFLNALRVLYGLQADEPNRGFSLTDEDKRQAAQTHSHYLRAQKNLAIYQQRTSTHQDQNQVEMLEHAQQNLEVVYRLAMRYSQPELFREAQGQLQNRLECFSGMIDAARRAVTETRLQQLRNDLKCQLEQYESFCNMHFTDEQLAYLFQKVTAVITRDLNPNVVPKNEGVMAFTEMQQRFLGGFRQENAALNVELLCKEQVEMMKPQQKVFEESLRTMHCLVESVTSDTSCEAPEKVVDRVQAEQAKLSKLLAEVEAISSENMEKQCPHLSSTLQYPNLYLLRTLPVSSYTKVAPSVAPITGMGFTPLSGTNVPLSYQAKATL
jgi:hypothetical protein